VDDPLALDRLALERRYAGLDRLHRRLWLPAIVNGEGSLPERLAALADWRERLLAGGEPMRADDRWPAADVAEAFAAAFERLDLPSLCRRHEEVTDQVLRSMLWHLDRLAAIASRLGRAEAARACADAFVEDWTTESADLKAVLRLFESLDGLASLANWSRVRGLLRDERWQSVLDTHATLQRLPGLAALIRRLGRVRPEHETELRDSATATDDAAARQWARRRVDVEIPGAAVEIEGIRRAGDLARLVASEAADWLRSRRRADREAVARPGAAMTPGRARRLRRLFAARLAEQSLLAYQHRQFVAEFRMIEAPAVASRSQPAPRARLEAGPMILCVDTSASMAGGPEQVGKAMVFEAMRTAARERRTCLLLAFSGPGDLRQLELGADADGLERLADFLASSFHGGTDIVDPVERALDLLETGAWRQADLLIASDGEFGATSALLDRLRAARERLGLRVQGVLIGDRETIGLREVADEVFWVRDWRRFGQRHAQIESPVHDSRLTRLYFPNASMRPPDPERSPEPARSPEPDRPAGPDQAESPDQAEDPDQPAG